MGDCGCTQCPCASCSLVCTNWFWQLWALHSKFQLHQSPLFALCPTYFWTITQTHLVTRYCKIISYFILRPRIIFMFWFIKLFLTCWRKKQIFRGMILSVRPTHLVESFSPWGHYWEIGGGGIYWGDAHGSRPDLHYHLISGGKSTVIDILREPSISFKTIYVVSF